MDVDHHAVTLQAGAGWRECTQQQHDEETGLEHAAVRVQSSQAKHNWWLFTKTQNVIYGDVIKQQFYYSNNMIKDV